MHDELETRLRAARDALGSSDPTTEQRVLDVLAGSASGRRRVRVPAWLGSRRVRLAGAAAAVCGLVGVFAVLLVMTRSSVTTAGGGPVILPDVTGMDVEAGYRALHELGLPVTVNEWMSLSSSADRIVATQTPAPGVEVPGDTPVVLATSGATRANPADGTAAPQSPVEDFTGRTIGAAVEWARSRQLAWEARVLPPLARATAPGLLENYTVARQDAAPGALVLNPVVDIGSVPRLSVPEFRFRDETFDQKPGVVDRTRPLRSLRERAGSVSAIVFTNPACSNCPRDPATPVPGLSIEDGHAPRFLVSLGRRTNLDVVRGGFWRFGEIEDADLESLGDLQVRPGDAMFVDRTGRVAAILAQPVETKRADEIVTMLRDEQIPSLAAFGLNITRMEGAPLAPSEVPSAFARIAGGSPGGSLRVYELTKQANGTRVVAGFDRSGDVLVQAEIPGLDSGLSSTPLVNLIEQLESNGGVAGFGGIGRPVGGREISSLVFLVEDGFTEVDVGGRTEPVDGNAVVIDVDVQRDPVAEFRGPGKMARVKLR